jgi:hypothetical protein
MLKVDVGSLQHDKHTPPKWVYKKYEIQSINTEPLKPNSPKKQMGHNPS